MLCASVAEFTAFAVGHAPAWDPYLSAVLATCISCHPLTPAAASTVGRCQAARRVAGQARLRLCGSKRYSEGAEDGIGDLPTPLAPVSGLAVMEQSCMAAVEGAKGLLIVWHTMPPSLHLRLWHACPCCGFLAAGCADTSVLNAKPLR
jgi:hypothetical protein